MIDTQDRALALKKSMERVRAVFKELNIVKARVDYEGSGDDGQTHTSWYEFADGNKRKALGAWSDEEGVMDSEVFEYMVQDQVYFQHTYSQAKDGWVTIESRRDIELSELLIDLADQFLDLEHGGWETNEGAEGYVIFDMQNVHVHHVDFYTESRVISNDYPSDGF